MISTLTKTILLGVAILISGCASTATDPSKVTWGDMIQGDRLESHLGKRRNELARLEKQASSLGHRLLIKQNEINTLNSQLSSVQAKSSRSAKELDQLNSDVQSKKRELEVTIAKAEELKQKEAELRESLVTLKDKRVAAEKLMRYELEIEQLETEVTTLEHAIDRTLLVRAKHALEAQ